MSKAKTNRMPARMVSRLRQVEKMLGLESSSFDFDPVKNAMIKDEIRLWIRPAVRSAADWGEGKPGTFDRYGYFYLAEE